ncbi:hypothetical protein [Natronospora cellulosivora (SeqCode)]
MKLKIIFILFLFCFSLTSFGFEYGAEYYINEIDKLTNEFISINDLNIEQLDLSLEDSNNKEMSINSINVFSYQMTDIEKRNLSLSEGYVYRVYNYEKDNWSLGLDFNFDDEGDHETTTLSLSITLD